MTLALSGGEPALGSAVVLDDVELIVRVGETTRRVRFDDRVVHAAAELPLELPELASNPAQRVAVYLRARTGAGAEVQEVGAVTQRQANEALESRYALQLSRTCVAAPCAQPPPRRGAALAFDPHSRHLVLFGGRQQDGTALDDTWEWDGLGWFRVTTSSAPAARAGHTVTLDVRSGNLLLFGGAGGSPQAPQLFGDTWEYRGAALGGWHHLTDAGPPARYQAAMASATIGDNEGRAGVLLHGGIGTAGGTLGDTWVWNGQVWSAPPQQNDTCPATPQPNPLLPRCRSQSALVSTADHRALLIGGRLGTSAAPESDDVVWQWDGTRWSPAPIYRPATVLGRYGHFAGSAPTTAGPLALVALGDSASGLRQDSFLLDLTSGQFAPQLGPAPAARAEAAVAYDDERAEVVLLGGRGQSALLNDSWSFTPSAGWRVHK